MTAVTKEKPFRVPKRIREKPLAELLLMFDACADARAWADKYETASAAWLACKDPSWMLWALRAIGYENDSKFRLFACWCVRNTPLADGRKVWDLLIDERTRTAVEVAERFARGEATKEQLAAARAAARAAAYDAAYDAARDAAYDADYDAAYAAQCHALRKIVGNPF